MRDISPKQRLIEKLRMHHEILEVRGSSLIEVNSKALLYVRCCKNLANTGEFPGRFWFGVTQSEYERYERQNLFVVCLCAVRHDETDCLVFPSDVFDQIKKDIPLRSGQWKFNLLKTPDKKYMLHISNKGKRDVSDFVNYFDFSPKEVRGVCSPTLREVEAATRKREPVADSRLPLSLDDELLQASKDSNNPKRFEVALERFFSEIGFRCRRIGGPGETDILVSEPVRFIVDGKSTKADSKSNINFTRIKRHMKQNDAEFMVIVSVAFAPAIARDAEMEGATLLDVQTLTELLKIHREYVPSPFTYADALRRQGVVDGQHVEALRQKIKHERDVLGRLTVLLENLDFVPRSVDEIKGRTDLYCEQHQAPVIDKSELERLLAFLADGCLQIVAFQEGKWLSRYLPQFAKERLKSVVRMLCLEQCPGMIGRNGYSVLLHGYAQEKGLLGG